MLCLLGMLSMCNPSYARSPRGAREQVGMTIMRDEILAQLLALHLSLARGLDPDRPRGLTKVTRTR